MSQTRQSAVVLVDNEGNCFIFDRTAFERARVRAENSVELRALLESRQVQGYAGSGMIDIPTTAVPRNTGVGIPANAVPKNTVIDIPPGAVPVYSIGMISNLTISSSHLFSLLN